MGSDPFSSFSFIFSLSLYIYIYIYPNISALMVFSPSFALSTILFFLSVSLFSVPSSLCPSQSLIPSLSFLPIFIFFFSCLYFVYCVYKYTYVLVPHPSLVFHFLMCAFLQSHCLSFSKASLSVIFFGVCLELPNKFQKGVISSNPSLQNNEHDKKTRIWFKGQLMPLTPNNICFAVFAGASCDSLKIVCLIHHQHFLVDLVPVEFMKTKYNMLKLSPMFNVTCFTKLYKILLVSTFICSVDHCLGNFCGVCHSECVGGLVGLWGKLGWDGGELSDVSQQ